MKVISSAADSSTVNKGSGACLEKLPDYEVLRSNNMNQINNYYEDLLIHQNGGGGISSIHALKRMRLHDCIVDELIERLHIMKIY